jgi:hypothetical protein
MTSIRQLLGSLIRGESPARKVNPALGELEIGLDRTYQVLELDIEESEPRWLHGDWGGQDVAVIPTLSDLQNEPSDTPRIVSAAMMLQKAKQFDDGLYAAVELAAQAGAGSFPGKAAMLREVLDALARGTPRLGDLAAARLFAAAQLGGLEPAVPDLLERAVQDELDGFEANEERSKPISFYTWSDELRAIFRQDRLLQERFENHGDVELVLRTLHSLQPTRKVYEAYLALVERLTNPFAQDEPDLRGLLAQLDRGDTVLGIESNVFFPPSRSHETDLVKRLFGAQADVPFRTIPESFDLLTTLIERIRRGELSLSPRPDSGWYDLQTWSFEPLLLPEKTAESSKIRTSARYRKCLEELFKGSLVLARETHIKQLEVLELGSLALQKLVISPTLTVEPLCTCYLRRAVGYALVRALLEGFFGPGTAGRMHRQSADGPRDIDLDTDLRHTAGLFLGAFTAAGEDLGLSRAEQERMIEDQLAESKLPPGALSDLGSGAGQDSDLETFRRWSEPGDDPDLCGDVRTMVPVFFDLERQMLKVWVFLGWTRRKLEVSFAEPPGVRVLDPEGREVNAPIEWGVQRYDVAYPVTAEVYVTRVLDRTEFRAHCDRYRTRSAILENLV